MYQNGYKNLVAILEKKEDQGVYSASFKSVAPQAGYERHLLIYNTPFSTNTVAAIEWGQLEKGRVRSDYRQAPEDVEAGIDQRTGTDRWAVNRYNATSEDVLESPNTVKIPVSAIPTIALIRGKNEVSSKLALDLVDSTEYTDYAASVFHLFTYLYSSVDKTVSVVISHSSEANLYVNGSEVYASVAHNLETSVAINLIQGWNSIDVLLNNVETAGAIRFGNNLKNLADAMSCYYGGGNSASQIKQLSDEIDLRVQLGEIIAGINISNDVINGARIEITGDTIFKDDVIMDSGVIRSGDGDIEIDINNGTINLGKPLTINHKPVATSDDIDALGERATAVESNLGEMSVKWNFVDSSIQMSEDGMLISGVIYNAERDINEPTGMEILLSKDKISFLDNGTEVAFISGKVLQINQGIFVKSMQVGSHMTQAHPSNPKITVVSYVGGQ